MFARRFSGATGHVGIDFGTRAIKMLQLRENRHRLRVVGAGMVAVPATAGVIDRGSLTDQLRGAFASGGFTGRRCVVSLRREDVCVQSVRLPRMPDDELRQAAVWEAAQRFGFDRTAMEAIKLIAGLGEPLLGRVLCYDLRDMTFHTLTLRRDPDCPICREV